jgi:hypothetical protein
MRYSKLLACGAVVLGIALSGTQAKAEDDWHDRDIRHDRQDLRHDYAQADRLRNDIAADRYRRNEDLRYGRPYAAYREQRDIDRDDHRLNSLDRDMRHDRRDLSWDYRR